jgi:hypothetical protein
VVDPLNGGAHHGCWGFRVLRPVDVAPIPKATAALAWQVHPRGTDEMRVRDALGPLFTDADFTTGPLAGMYPDLGQPGLSQVLLLMVVILQFRQNLSAQALAEQIGADGQELLDAIDADPAAGWMNDLPEVAVLRTVWDQQLERTRSGQLLPKDVEDLPPAAERIHSPHDADARHSTKTTLAGEADLEWVGSNG